MKIKTLIVTIAVLAVLSGVAYWANRPEAPTNSDARVDKPVVDSSVIDKAAKISLTDQGKTVVVSRQADGSWKDDSYFDMPADFSKLSSFIGDLTSSKIQRLVTTNPGRIARLEFSGSKIEFLDSSDHPTFTLDIGKTADSGGRFIRYGDEPKAYLAGTSIWMDTDPKNWADAQLVNLKPDDVAKIEVPFDQAPTEILSREKKGAAWTASPIPAGKQVIADKVTSLLTSLGAVRFSETTASDDAMAATAKEHLRVFKLTTFDGKVFTIAMGRKPEEKKLKPVETKAEPTASEAKPASAATDGSQTSTTDAAGATKPAAEKPPEPQYDTIPAGPVFIWVTSSDSKAGVNALMQKRSFQVDDYTFTGLPQKSDELFEAAPPPPAPAAKPESKAN
jgi:uncharacterized protein DUF4340